MKIDIAEINYKPVWFDHDDCRLKIRPYPLGQSNFFLEEGNVVFPHKERYKMFEYSLMEWEGVKDSEGKDLPLTKKIKRKIFDYRLGGISDFVLVTNMDFLSKKEKSEKNLENGLDGK
jgi:hypothetical protein